MINSGLLGVFRIEVDDTVATYLWSDALIYGYIDDAQKQFCRDTYGIEDARSFRLNIKADGTQWYALDPAILKVRSAIDPATGLDIPLIALEKMRENSLRFDTATGPIKALITGMDKGYLRALPIPNVASVVELRTFRLPADLENPTDEFEIDQQHVRALLLWVKHRAYAVQDTEVYDPRLSEKFRAQWDTYCAKAKNEQERLNRSASTVAYGGL